MSDATTRPRGQAVPDRPTLAAVLLCLLAVSAYAVATVTDSAGPYGVLYLAAVLGAAALALIGACRQHAGSRLIPLLVALGLLGSSIGDGFWYAFTWTSAVPDVSIADAFYFSGYIGLGGALLITALRGDHGRIDVDGLLDALTLAVVSLMVLWDLSAGDIVADTAHSTST
ncbi:MAG: hypothetical protein F2667_10935, partial [Actinobacteria bacterium]|nr:hypothetical protein [Actinomycetota bacterium]